MNNFVESPSDRLEIDYGTAILSALCGQILNRNQQPVRLFDQTRQSSECFYRSDERGKPYIQNFQTGKRYYPLTAYCQVYRVDYKTAVSDLSRQYYGVDRMTDITSIVPLRQRIAPLQPPVVKPNILPFELYQQSQKEFSRNGLYEYLRFLFGAAEAEQTFMAYRLGTSRRWRYLGYLATCLPQFDLNGNLRQVKIMPFDAMNGRRIKTNQDCEIWNLKSRIYEPTSDGSDKSYFAGNYLARQAGIKEPSLQQCFFGEHLLSEYPQKRVGIVEGETTALVCSLYWPDYVWLATGGSNGCGWNKLEKFGVLTGRKVVLWPDTGKFTDWSQKAEPLRSLVASLQVSNYVEINTPPGLNNVDLRDLLTRPYCVSGNIQKPLYGELLTVDEATDYPSDWDDPVSADAVPMIRQ